jgi:hypothetical protein
MFERLLKATQDRVGIVADEQILYEQEKEKQEMKRLMNEIKRNITVHRPTSANAQLGRKKAKKN